MCAQGLERSRDKAASVASLKKAWACVSAMHAEHSKHEDEIIFKAYEQLFPSVTAQASAEHEQVSN